MLLIVVDEREETAMSSLIPEISINNIHLFSRETKKITEFLPSENMMTGNQVHNFQMIEH